MIWQKLSAPWQAAVEEAWAAYTDGSLPHGAVLVDSNGHIVSRGRNRINDKTADGTILHGHRMAHAELNALLQADWNKVNPSTSTLYSTIEPCPMCIGAVRMSQVQTLHFATRDHTSGSTFLIEKSPYLQRGNIHAIHSDDTNLEIILLGILIESVLSHPSYPQKEAWAAQLASGLPAANKLGRSLSASGELRQWRDEGKPADFVINQLAEQVKTITTTAK